MRNLTIALIFFVGITLAQDKAPEPYRIKSDILGEPISTYRQNNPECTETDSHNGLPNFAHINNSSKLSGACSALGLDPNLKLTYADVHMESKIASFDEDRFVELFYGMEHYLYSHVRDNLIAKFGQPTRKELEDLQNRMGAHFSGEALFWDNGVSTILLHEYAGDLDSSSLTFILTDYLEQQRRRKQTKKASPDM
jgi:hypothetical protein